MIDSQFCSAKDYGFSVLQIRCFVNLLFLTDFIEIHAYNI
jgi:hypothetical protein